LWGRSPKGEAPSSKSEAQRGNNMAKSTPSFEFTNGGIQEFIILL